MGYVITADTNYPAIADAIRAANGTTDTYTPSEMPDAISQLTAGGNDYDGMKSAAVGDTRTIDMGTYGSHSFTCIAVNQDVDQEGNAVATTWLCDDIVALQAPNTSDNANGGWETSKVRALCASMLSSMPIDLQKAVKTVAKGNTSGYGAATTYDKVWIPSESEVSSSYSGEGALYSPLDSSSARVRKYNSSAYSWWLRSVYFSYYFWSVTSSGVLSDSVASVSLGVVPGFCI